MYVMEDFVIEVCRRIRCKIYLVFLEYVDKIVVKYFNVL